MSSLKFKNENGEWQRIAGYSSVAAFNGRAGVVRPQAGDYTAEMVGAAPAVHTHTPDQVGAVNTNLLHNWYFANLVNQRGQTEYTAPSAIIHTIDRWWMCYFGTVTLGSDGLTITNPASVGTIDFGQTMEFGDFLPGRTVTISVMIDGEVSGEDIEIPSVPTLNSIVGSLVFDWGEVCLIYDANGMFRLVFRLNPLATATNVQAVKLELGSTQTLAHQDADGNWVLNEIPDYGEELRKCKRYQKKVFLRSLPAESVATQMIQFAVNDAFTDMRATPVVTLVGEQAKTTDSSTSGKVAVIPNGNGHVGWHISEGVTYTTILRNKGVIIRATVPETAFTVTATGGTDYILTAGDGVHLFLDANL